MLIIGISGQTGAGKSTTANILSELGYGENLEVDAVGHELLTDTNTKSVLVEKFGKEIIDPSGEVDRKILGRKVFSNEENTLILNNIMHPAMVKKIGDYIGKRKKQGINSIIINAALLFTMKLDLLCNKLIYVQSDPQLRLNRLIQYRSLPEDRAKERLFAQDKLPENRKDIIIIENNGNESELKANITKIAKQFL
ncbi:MAG: dephospho-CoA kinase [Candidatus Riflebacteria bacterium]|nr:dephospho-CoA kinase [Candidatus Riflebacteria bacterium]